MSMRQLDEAQKPNEMTGTVMKVETKKGFTFTADYLMINYKEIS